MLASHNPLQQQYKKKQATDEVYRPYAMAHEKQKSRRREENTIYSQMDTNSRYIIHII